MPISTSIHTKRSTAGKLLEDQNVKKANPNVPGKKSKLRTRIYDPKWTSYTWMGKVLQHDSADHAMLYLCEACSRGRKEAFVEFLKFALKNYDSPLLLPDGCKSKVQDVMRKIKKFSFRNVPEGWVDFFAEYLPDSSIHKLEIGRYAECLIKFSPK